MLGTDYISEEPRSSTHVRTFPDLPKPRIFYLRVTKFTYISSKGEGNFASRAVRPLEQITRNWKIDIEEDEEKKRGLVMQVTASQVVSAYKLLQTCLLVTLTNLFSRGPLLAYS